MVVTVSAAVEVERKMVVEMVVTVAAVVEVEQRWWLRC